MQLKSFHEVGEVRVLICIVLAQILASGVYGVDLLVMRLQLQQMDTVGSLEDAVFLVVVGSMVLITEVSFAVLCVRRESSCDLVIVQVFAVLSSCCPLFTEIYISSLGMPQRLSGCQARVRIVLLCVIGICALALMVVALRVSREFSWRRGQHKVDLDLAMMVGAVYYLDVALTLLVVCLPINSRFREHLFDSAILAAVITAVATVSSAAFLGASFFFSSRPHLVSRPCLQRMVYSLGSASAIVIGVWMVFTLVQPARIGAPLDANGSTEVLGTMSQVTATVLMCVALIVRIVLLLLLRRACRDPEGTAIWSAIYHYLRADARKTMVSHQTMHRMTLLSDALDDGSHDARRKINRAKLGLKVVTCGDFLSMRRPWQPPQNSLLRCCRSGRALLPATDRNQAHPTDETPNSDHAITTQTAAQGAAGHFTGDTAHGHLAPGLSAATDEGGDGQPRVRKTKRFVQRTQRATQNTCDSRCTCLPTAADIRADSLLPPIACCAVSEDFSTLRWAWTGGYLLVARIRSIKALQEPRPAGAERSLNSRVERARLSRRASTAKLGSFGSSAALTVDRAVAAFESAEEEWIRVTFELASGYRDYIDLGFPVGSRKLQHWLDGLNGALAAMPPSPLGPLRGWLADAFRAADLPDLGHIHLPGVVVDALAARRNGPTAHDGRYQRCARWLWHHVERQLILGSWRERLAITKRQTSFERLMHAINSPPEAGVAALMDPEYDGLRAHRRERTIDFFDVEDLVACMLERETPLQEVFNAYATHINPDAANGRQQSTRWLTLEGWLRFCASEQCRSGEKPTPAQIEHQRALFQQFARNVRSDLEEGSTSFSTSGSAPQPLPLPTPLSAPSVVGGAPMHLRLRDFELLLLHMSNHALDEDALNADEDLSLPLSEYFIESSHNTYIVGNQLTGRSEVAMYHRVLLEGCRCLEIDLWDGADGEPAVTHGGTLVTRIKFIDVLAAIVESAFVMSKAPLILSFEMHCSPPQQMRCAVLLREWFGDDMIWQKDVERMGNLPVKELLGRVIVKGKDQRTREFPATMSIEKRPSFSCHSSCSAPVDLTCSCPLQVRRRRVQARAEKRHLHLSQYGGCPRTVQSGAKRWRQKKRAAKGRTHLQQMRASSRTCTSWPVSSLVARCSWWTCVSRTR